jgi:hypothetical protein
MVFDPTNNDKLIMASEDNGMFEFDLKNEKMKVLGDELFPSHLWSCEISRDGKTMWACTVNNGVWIYHPGEKKQE